MPVFLKILNRFWQHRSLLATLFFIVTVGFLDQYSVLNLVQLLSKNADLKAEIHRHKEEYEAATRALRQMETSPEAVEKVARVNLLMKTANEDIYVVVEE